MDGLKKVGVWKGHPPAPGAKCGLVLFAIVKRKGVGKVYVDDLGDPHMLLLAGPGLQKLKWHRGVGKQG